MDEKTTELIAIGASVGAHCQPCLTWHLTKARELGIDDASIHAAIEIGHRVEKGAMSAMHKFSTELLAPREVAEKPELCAALKSLGIGEEA